MGTATAETRIPLAEAERIAGEIVQLLAPYCERIEIAGSIRRRRPLVKDIELLCVPRVIRTATDLFGTQHAETDQLHAHATALREEGRFGDRLDKNARPAFGERYKRLTYEGIALDLFSVKPPAQWGLQLVIRSGPAEFSHRLVSNIMHRLPDGSTGLLPHGLKVDRGAIWRLDWRGLPSELVPTPTEESVFEVLGIAWVAPEDRL